MLQMSSPAESFAAPGCHNGLEAARALNRQAIARLMQGDAAGALADFRRAVEMDGSYAEPWNNSGLIRHNLGQLTEAAADFDRALALRPDYAEALTNGARCNSRAISCRCPGKTTTGPPFRRAVRRLGPAQPRCSSPADGRPGRGGGRLRPGPADRPGARRHLRTPRHGRKEAGDLSAPALT